MEHLTFRIPKNLKTALESHTGNISEYLREIIRENLAGKIRIANQEKRINIDKTKPVSEILTDFSQFIKVQNPVQSLVTPFSELMHSWQSAYLKNIHRTGGSVNISLKPRQCGWDTLHMMIAHWFFADNDRPRNILYMAPSDNQAKILKRSYFNLNIGDMQDYFRYSVTSTRAQYCSNSLGNGIAFKSPKDWLKSYHDIKEYDIIIASEFAFYTANFNEILPDIVNHVQGDPTKYLFCGSSLRSFSEDDLQDIQDLNQIQVDNKYIIKHPVHISKKIKLQGFEDAILSYKPEIIHTLYEGEQGLDSFGILQ